MALVYHPVAPRFQLDRIFVKPVETSKPIPAPVTPTINPEIGLIVLSSPQVEHLQRIENILTNYHSYVDSSPTGTGKTFVAFALSLRRQLPIFLVGGKTPITKWKYLAPHNGVELIESLTYEGLRSSGTHQPSHGYLLRQCERDKVKFQVTEAFRSLVRKGILLVFDEFHHIKNENQQSDACRVLIDAVVEEKSNSRIAFLSATPFDRSENSVLMLRLLSLFRHPQLFGIDDKGKRQELGFRELVNRCREFNPENTETALLVCPLDLHMTERTCFELFVRVVKPHLFSSMPPSNMERDIRNGYYNISESHEDIIKRTVRELQGKKSEFHQALTRLEGAKLEVLIRKTRELLSQNDRNKVILLVNYTDSLFHLQARLNIYKPLIIYGQTTGPMRHERIECFQAATTEYRLLIANIQTINEGIDLHDTDGNFPRFVFAIPNFSPTIMHQAAGRVYRFESKSLAHVRFVYCKAVPEESMCLKFSDDHLSKSLQEKTLVLNRLLFEQIKQGVKFPADYDCEVEE